MLLQLINQMMQILEEKNVPLAQLQVALADFAIMLKAYTPLLATITREQVRAGVRVFRLQY